MKTYIISQAFLQILRNKFNDIRNTLKIMNKKIECITNNTDSIAKNKFKSKFESLSFIK